MADGVEESAFIQFVEVHRAQLEANNIPRTYWRAIHVKIKNETYDAGRFFSMMKNEENDSWQVIVTNEEGLKATDENSVFLIDHAWTYQLEFARKQLECVPGLRDRMASLMGLQVNESSSEGNLIQEVMDKMWRYNHMYHLRMMKYVGGEIVQQKPRDEDLVAFWYVLDEFGSRICHSDEPSVDMKPIYHVPSQMSFTVMWLLKDLEYGEDVTIDYVSKIKDPLLRATCLLPWFPEPLPFDLNEEIPLGPPYPIVVQGETKKSNGLLTDCKNCRTPKDGIYRVYSDVNNVLNFLTNPKFELVDSREEADILWLMENFKDFRLLCDTGKYVNQFPAESNLTCKDLLARCAQRLKTGQTDMHRGPEWIPTTFNMTTELPQFVQHYFQRKGRGLDNHWICKPWNLARSLDTYITSNIDCLIRLAETGPKVASKYLENSVLFNRPDVGLVKIDIRYLVLLTSVKPLVLHLDKKFWLRFANKPFSMDHFDDYQKHFTVMNYREDTNLKQIHYYEFIPMFEKQYPDYKWDDLEAKIGRALRELFEAATLEPPPDGIGHFSQSRAFYAVDLMLKWADDGSNEIVPQILEVNFCPDCDRACKYYPDFFNFIFSLLFLGDPEGWPVVQL